MNESSLTDQCIYMYIQPTMIVSNKSIKPLYKQVKDYVKALLTTKDWDMDKRIPSENELVEKLGVSRMTVNRAFRELVTEGVIRRVQGIGTFAAEPKPQVALFEIKSIAKEIKSWGGIHSSEIILIREETASDELFLDMKLLPDKKVFHSIIVHRDRGRAIQVADRYVNPKADPDYLKHDFSKLTPNDYLMKAALVTEVEHVVEAVHPDRSVKKLLELANDETCLVLHRKTWSGKIVVTRSTFTYPGSMYRFGGRYRPETHSALWR